ncbi:E3 ubiquitin-protein ligase SHPRH isoform X2 [Cucurbita pepo subsp. pepo]|uniref:E3 ubiquitin-protein ligase SHPRH isoform X2 n=1 Tax=Cucurbita pepo subsp. pepo TaxID=3664 RepID=UPI000C9D50EE|nr:E3 ubiquitin-protein ligase SHPRH isoform X2 [Cucurbita pepo subsp. pepo]
MGRRKQKQPHRSGGIRFEDPVNPKTQVDIHGIVETVESSDIKLDEVNEPFFVEVDRTGWHSNEHHDISEVVLMDIRLEHPFVGIRSEEIFCESSRYSLRFRLCNDNGFLLDRIKFGHWPVLSSNEISLELIERRVEEDMNGCLVVLSGSFDGPDEAISGLVHLANLKFVTLRPVMGVSFSQNMGSLRLRVEILSSAFDACGSILDSGRQLWKKSMMNTIAWLRPEVVSSEVKYGVVESTNMDAHLHRETGDDASSSRKHVNFDSVAFYDAIKPSKDDPMLDEDIPNLLPKLRPYQRRAAYWMVQREKGFSRNFGVGENVQLISPLCMPLECLDTRSRMFYNPFSGDLTWNAEQTLPHVYGGILADEMGLGKTIELLACILSHPMSVFEDGKGFDDEMQQLVGDQRTKFKRLKRERVECVCGAVSENHRYEGLWVQCDICDAWQHADCVGYSPKGRVLEPVDTKDGNCRKDKRNKRNTVNVTVRDEEHVCMPCLELMQATDSPMTTGSIKLLVYEGVRDTSLSNTLPVQINDIINSDIVLTSYDVLKEDLSHDYDRHEGDRRFMRFQKRYPVVPTPLTRIFWWRICLDEGQMVESNATAATEMASRLYASHRWCITGTPIQRKLEDLFGLLRFVKASPFNVHRWWVEVIRDPYERRDPGAMEFTHKFFKQIMWRSLKVHVTDELQLPPQEEQVTWLTFSPIEENFYQRQHETCVSYAREVIQGLKDDFVKRKVPGFVSSDVPSDILITHADAGKLLNTLLKLRQACCHPQVGSSGLRSLQQSPMTMEEILMVLVSKTKIEGEEALRRTVVALNALAGIAIIEKKFSEALSLYKEALELAEENNEDFRVDPLLSIHIHHNLAEILPLAMDQIQSPLKDQFYPRTCEVKASKMDDSEKSDNHIIKKQKVNGTLYVPCSDTEKIIDSPLELTGQDENAKKEENYEPHRSSSYFNDNYLRKACEAMRQKYLAVFSSKLSIAQQEFTKSYVQVCNELKSRENLNEVWWLQAVHHAEQNKDFSHELIRKIEEAVSGNLNNSKSRVGSRFRSIDALKYHVQTGLDLLEASRKLVLGRLLEIDQTMENPKDEDIERVRYCQNCQADSNGPPCVLCELDELFQEYEARLFRLNTVQGGMVTSVEEAVEAQKKKSALNRFYWSLLQQNKNLSSSRDGYEESNKRDAGERVVVSKHPSELEVVLGVIKNFCKTQLGKESIAAANKQLHLLEYMRKEYGHARSLAIAQAQVLNAHDEIKMATTRLCLRGNDDDDSAYAISEHELPAASVQYSSDKFVSLAMLSRVKGKLRYLKGLVQSKQNIPLGSSSNPASTQVPDITSTSVEQKSENTLKADEESCPVCQEALSNQKMVFQCGHMTCCKCLFAMTEKKLRDSTIQTKWVMCPTCRQHTDFGNIAYADDSKNETLDPSTLHKTSREDERSIRVQGSYGTKIEAVVRRILWIKYTDSEAKVLVFSSWNDVLDVLQYAFAANNITFVRMKGGRKSHTAISEFRGQKINTKENHKKQPLAEVPELRSAQVLLLLIQHGANGLNLLEAQHVILVEPLLNPAAEAQAISRVHRIGQQNKTFVHRFIVKDTVEESIHRLNRSRESSSFITGNTKNQDQPVFTLKEVESLFASRPSPLRESDEKESETLRHLAPSMAATIAAERRLKEHTT